VLTVNRAQLTKRTNPATAASPVSLSSAKGFACFNCATRKTRCDRERPVCAACRRRQLTCVYEDAAAAGSRKRKATEDTNGRLERFERILAEHGLTTEKANRSESRPAATVDGLNAISAEPAESTGRLVVDKSNSRYINSTLWRDVENHGLGQIVEEEMFGAAVDSTASTSDFALPSLSCGLLGATKSLSEYHPNATEAT
jgi:Fungal Zn(2)-Cys(6) binuclear cluster domain